SPKYGNNRSRWTSGHGADPRGTRPERAALLALGFLFTFFVFRENSYGASTIQIAGCSMRNDSCDRIFQATRTIRRRSNIASYRSFGKNCALRIHTSPFSHARLVIATQPRPLACLAHRGWDERRSGGSAVRRVLRAVDRGGRADRAGFSVH